MSSTVKLGRDLTSLSNQLTSLETQLSTSKNLINSYASSANSATSKSAYDSNVSSYNSEKSNFDNLVSSYQDLGGQYSATLDKYNTLTFSNEANVVTYELPNAKDQYQWLAGGEFYNEKNPGGYAWSPTNPLAPNEKVKQDLGLVVNRGSYHSYLNEGFTEIQNEIRGFGFLDLLGDYTESKTTTYEVTITVTSSDGTIHVDTNYIEGNGSGLDSIQSMTQSNMSVDIISSMLSAPGMDLSTINAIGVVQFAITNMLTGKFFNSPTIELGNMIGASLYQTTKDVISRQLTMGIVSTLGVTNIFAAALINIGVGALVGEFLEIAMGADNHFGFGGEIVGTDAFGKSVHSENKGILEGIKETVGSFFGNEYSNHLTNYDNSFTYGQANANYAELTTSTLGEFNLLSRNLDQGGSLGYNGRGEIGISTFGSFKELEKNLNLNGIDSPTGFNGANPLSDGGWGNIGNSGDDDGYEGNNN